MIAPCYREAAPSVYIRAPEGLWILQDRGKQQTAGDDQRHQRGQRRVVEPHHHTGQSQAEKALNEKHDAANAKFGSWSTTFTVVLEFPSSQGGLSSETRIDLEGARPFYR